MNLMSLKHANFAWFRFAVAEEPDDAKRRELEQKLAQAEAEFEASLRVEEKVDA